MAPDPWQFIPRTVLNDEKVRSDAAAWAEQQRKALAEQWAQAQRQISQNVAQQATASVGQAFAPAAPSAGAFTGASNDVGTALVQGAMPPQPSPLDELISEAEARKRQNAADIGRFQAGPEDLSGFAMDTLARPQSSIRGVAEAVRRVDPNANTVPDVARAALSNPGELIRGAVEGLTNPKPQEHQLGDWVEQDLVRQGVDPTIAKVGGFAIGMVDDPTNWVNPSGKALAKFAPGLGLKVVSGTKGVRSISPEVDVLSKMYDTPPRPVSESPVSIPESARRDFFRAMTDRGIDASILRQETARSMEAAGKKLDPSDYIDYLQRLDPQKAAEVKVQEAVRPALKLADEVGPDGQVLLANYMTVKHNVEVALQKGKEAAASVAAQARPKSVTDKQLDVAKFQLTRLKGDKAQYAAGSSTSVIDSQIVKKEAEIKALQGKVDAASMRFEARQKGKAATAGASVTAARQFSGGLDIAKSKQALTDMQAALGSADTAKLDSAAQRIWDMNRAQLDRAHDVGLVTDEAYQAMTDAYDFYSPIKILDYMERADSATGAGKGIGKSLSVSDNQIRRLSQEGTARAQENPIVSSIRNTYTTESVIAKQRTFNALVKYMDENPTFKAAVQKVAGDADHTADLVPVVGFEKGEKVKYLLPDYLGNIITQEVGAPIPIIAPVLGVWRALVTSASPYFLPANALLDAGTYMLREMTRGGGPQAAPKALAELVRAYGDTFQGLFTSEYKAGLADFYKAGGGMGGWTSLKPSDPNRTSSRLAEWIQARTGIQVARDYGKVALQDLSRVNALEVKSKGDILRILGDIVTLKPIQAVGERIEQAPRVASYRLAQKRGLGQTQAVINGRTVTIDFAQGGYLAKTINGFVPFFNVAIQGGATLARAARENPRGFAATAMTTLVAPTLAAEAWNRADPQRGKDYADVPDYIKDQGVVVMLPGEAPVDAQGNRHPQFVHLRTREFSPFVILTRLVAERALGDDPRAWQDVAGGLLQSVTPVQSVDVGSIAGQALLPGVSTALELQQNKNFFTNSPIQSERKDQQASALGQVAGKALGVSPAKADFAVRDLGGGVGQLAQETSNLAAGRPSTGAGPSGVPVLGPGLKRFVRGDIGRQLDQAQGKVMPPAVQADINASGVQYNATPVGSKISGVPVTMAEQAEIQKRTNQYFTEYMQEMMADPDWRSYDAATKEDIIRQFQAAARSQAGAEVLGEVPEVELGKRVEAVGAK